MPSGTKLNEIETSYHKLKELIDYSLNEIKIVEHDYRIYESGQKVHYALDFSTIFKIAFGNERINKENSSIGEEIGAKRAATVFLLYGIKDIGNLVILEPHLKELRNYLKKLRKEIRPLAFQNSEYIRRLFEEKMEIGDFDLIRKALDTLKREKKLAGPIRTDIMNLFKERFLGLYMVLSSPEYKQSLKILKNLFSNSECKISDPYALWPLLTNELKSINNFPPRQLKYFNKLQNIRNLSQFYIPNLIDSRAFQMIDSINNFFISREPSIKITDQMVLVSDTDAAKKVLYLANEPYLMHHSKRINEPHIPVLRTSDTLCMYLRCINLNDGFANNSSKNNIRYISEFLDTLETNIRPHYRHYIRLTKDCTLDCQNCAQRDECDELLSALNKSIENLQTKLLSENLSLNISAAHKQILSPYSQVVKNDENINNVIQFFCAETGLEEALQQAALDLLFQIEETTIDNMPFNNFNLLSLDILDIIENYNLQSMNERTMNIIYSWKKSSESNDLSKAKECYTELIKISRDNINNDYIIVNSLILLINRDWDGVISFLESEKEVEIRAGDEEELAILLARAYSAILEEDKESKEFLLWVYNQILELNSIYNKRNTNPKWINISAVAKISSIDAGIEDSQKYELVLHDLKKAIDIVETSGEDYRYFKNFLLNNIAFTYYKSSELPSQSIGIKKHKIEKGLEFLEKIKINEINDHKDYRIMDTFGHIYLGKFSTVHDNRQKKRNLQKALKYFEESYEFAKIRGDDKMLDKLEINIRQITNRI